MDTNCSCIPSTPSAAKAKFLSWFTENGGLSKYIHFPARCLPSNCLGIMAIQDIPPNTVFLAVPKKLIIGPEAVMASELRKVIEAHDILHNSEEDDETQYNQITMFLIMESMKGDQSFYAPYLNCLESPETIFDWSRQEIEELHDPRLTVSEVQTVVTSFNELYQKLREICSQHKELFPVQPLPRSLFDYCYGLVMTRCFGWGLPETMMVPFADFLNHNSWGVNHYVFNRSLQGKMSKDNSHQTHQTFHTDSDLSNNSEITIEKQKLPTQETLKDKCQPNPQKTQLSQFSSLKTEQCSIETKQCSIKTKQCSKTSSYIRKKQVLDLSLLGVDNKCRLPKAYQKDDRQKWIQTNWNKLPSGKYSQSLLAVRMAPQITNPLVDEIRRLKVEAHYNTSLYLSSDSEDNDSDEDNTSEKPKYFTYSHRCASRMAESRLQKRFTEPKPSINSQFETGVKFDWWFQVDSQQSYFIVSTSRAILKGEQIFNSYGRRSNSFLLEWYGFTFPNNKYDSVPFRLWSTAITQKKGLTLYLGNMSDVQYLHIVNRYLEYRAAASEDLRYSNSLISQEFRLKMYRLNYGLMVYLRLKAMDQDMARTVSKVCFDQCLTVKSFAIQQKVLSDYQIILQHLADRHALPKEWKVLKGFRRQFAQIYKSSNMAIIEAHQRAIKSLLEIVALVSRGMSVQTAYLMNHMEEETLHKDIKYQNRLMGNHYFHLLQSRVNNETPVA